MESFSPEARPPFHRASLVLTASGVSGFLIGLAFWDWQWAVEHAQVTAGLVGYSPASPTGIAHAKLWSIVPQLGAALLRTGVSETALSQILSGVLGLLSFQALAAVCYATGRSAVVALGAAFLVFVGRSTDYGVVYPTILLGSGHTYGSAGLSFVVLAIGLLGIGWYRTGSFLLSMSPAVHPALGLWAIAITAIAVVSFRRDGLAVLADPRRPIGAGVLARYVAAGAGVTLLSLAWHLARAPAVPVVDPATAHRFFQAFVTFWDAHRFPVPFQHKGVMLAFEAGLLAVVTLGCLGRRLNASTRLLLRIVAVGAAGSLVIAIWTNLPSAWMPDWIVSLMPGRLLNLGIFVLAPLVLGLSSALKLSWFSPALLVLVAAGLLSARGSSVWTIAGQRPVFDFAANSVLAVGTAGVLAAAVIVRRRSPPKLSREDRMLKTALVSVFGVAALVACVDASRNLSWRMETLPYWKTDPALVAAARGSGLLVTAGDLFLVQLRTRRPVLLDGGALDTLPYAPESGPGMDRILREVYGIDLFNPPPEAWRGGRVPPITNRQIWRTYSRDRWRQLGRDHGFGQILTPADWELDLAVVARSRDFRLYGLPE